MALKAYVQQEEFSSLDPVIQGEYTPIDGQDGAYMLAVESVQLPGTGKRSGPLYALEDIGGLKRALERQTGRADEYERLNKDFADLDPQTARNALSKVEEMQNWTPEQKVQEQIDSIKEQLESKHASEKDEWAGERKQLTDDVSTLLIDSEFTTILATDEYKGSPKLLLPHIHERVKVVRGENGKPELRVVDAEGRAMISRKPGNNEAMGRRELLKELMQDPEIAPGFSGSGASGSGARGDGSIPRGHARKLTQQEANDPAAYRRMKAEAEKSGVDFLTLLPGSDPQTQ